MMDTTYFIGVFHAADFLPLNGVKVEAERWGVFTALPNAAGVINKQPK